MSRYSQKPAQEIEDLLRDYIDDEWDEITAAEAPIPIAAERNPKRSGVYVREETDGEEHMRLRAKCSGEAGS